MPDWTVASLLQVSAEYLAGRVPDSPRLDAELLLAHALAVERIQLYVQYDRPLTPAEVDDYRALIARRARGEPVAHILGRAAFRYLDLEVSPAVLIPRPETEELVEAALAELRRRPPFPPRPGDGARGPAGVPSSSQPPPPVVADVGTGSGAIACSLASEGGVRVLATDVSREALAVAAANVARLGLSTAVRLREGDLLAGVDPGSLRLVVSNPPYVTEAEYAALDPQVRDFEPAAALVAGPEGLDVYRRLVPAAAAALAPGGVLLLEVGHTQAAVVEGICREAGFALTERILDLSGKERVVRAVRPGAPSLRPGSLAPWEKAALDRALAEGAVVGLPTDTVYGVAAAWDSGPGVRAMFAAKGRGTERPVAVLFSSVAEVRRHLPDLDEAASRVLGALLPGPFTFVVATGVPRPPLVGTEDSLGVRVPDHGALLALLADLGRPLAATSANPSGGRDAAGLAEVDPTVLAHCAAAFEGRGDAGAASTVVDLRPLAAGRPPEVLREGAVPAEETLRRVSAALGG